MQTISDKQKKIKLEIFDYLDTIVSTMVIALFIIIFFFSLSTVYGESMIPTLQNKNKVIVSSFFYKPKYKDIVVVTKPNYRHHLLVKRVIATEGQIVNIDSNLGKVFVDGKELDEPYIYEPTFYLDDISFPYTVEKNSVFVMGDNRNNSMDSRSSEVGSVDVRYIKGKVIFRWFPFHKFGVLN